MKEKGEMKTILLDLIQFHKQKCEDEECPIKLTPLLDIFTKLDIELTVEELKIVIPSRFDKECIPRPKDDK
jgi:hypothetical protein